MAGLLTYSLFECLPISYKPTVTSRIKKYINELTAAGTVQDLHLIPFSPYYSANNEHH